MHEKTIVQMYSVCVCLFLENMSFIFTDFGMTSGLFGIFQDKSIQKGIFFNQKVVFP